jgi:cysteine-rich repeat protein
MTNKNKNLIVFCVGLIAVTLVCFYPNWVAAQESEIMDTAETVAGTAGLSTEATDPRVIVGRLIRVALGFLGVAALVVILYGGFLYMTSGGVDTAIEKAKGVIKSGIIGLAIIIMAFAITSYILNALTGAVGTGSGGNDQTTPPGDDFNFTPGSELSFSVTISPSGAAKQPLNIPIKVKSSKILADNATQSVTVYLVEEERVQPEGGEVTTVEKETAIGGNFVFAPDKDNKWLTFVHQGECPLGCHGPCFQPNSKYRVKINKNLKNKDNQSLTCDPFAGDYCKTVDFYTGGTCDNIGPTVTLSLPPIPFQQGTMAHFAVDASDNFGVDSVTVYPDFSNVPNSIEVFDPDEAALLALNHTFDISIADMATGAYEVKASATDMVDNNKETPIKKYYIASAGCFDNGVFNCKLTTCDIPPEKCQSTNDDDNVYDCAIDENGEFSCKGYTRPIIDKVTPASAPAGAYVTISGRNFGSYNTNSKIEIGGVKVELGCGGAQSWSNYQAIVKITDAIVGGTIRLTNYFKTPEEGIFYNDTGILDTPGWKGSFTVETGDAASIGLCSVYKDGKAEGAINELVTANGVNFGDTVQNKNKVIFNNVDANLAIANWGDKTVSGIQIPNIVPSTVKVQVSNYNNQSGKILYSNPVDFTVKKIVSDMRIATVSPSPAAPTQYVTITGENFKNGGTVLLVGGEKSYDGILGCVGAWGDNSIVFQVPASIPNGNYTLRLVRSADSADAEFKNFTVDNTVAVTPGICEIKPNNGPIGTMVEIIGNGFGTAAGEVYFTDSVDGETIQYNKAPVENVKWSNKAIKELMVPDFAQSGKVYVKTAAGDSNEADFAVGNCKPGSCEEGKICCNFSSCVLEDDCEQSAPTSCDYTWKFSTGVLPNVPRIIERDCAIGGINGSPYPKKNSTDACAGSLIGFSFSRLMNWDSFTGRITFNRWAPKGNKCDYNDCLNDPNCVATTGVYDKNNGDFYETNFPITADNEPDPEVTQVILNSYGGLEPNMCYKVVVKAGLYADGSPEETMASDYSWVFKTSTAQCELSSIVMSPQEGVIKEITEKQNFKVNGQTANCGIVDVSDKKWDWRVTDMPNYVTRADDDPENSIFANYMAKNATEESPINHWDGISATVVGNPGLSGLGRVKVKFNEPKVIDYMPSCNAACVNAAMEATFNTYMNKTDLENPANILLYKCQEQSCEFGQERLFEDDLSLVASDCYEDNTDYCKKLSITLPFNNVFDAGAYYRVVVRNQVKSVSGFELTGLNYNSQKVFPNNDSFSWIFKTKDDGNYCNISRVKVVPVEYTATKFGEQIMYFAEAYGSADDCSKSGQRLNSYLYNWTWNSDNKPMVEPIAESYYTGLAGGCNDKCLNLGSNVYGAMCGNDHIEIGEECDDGNIAGNDGCSSKCLNEGVVGGTCGNGVKDDKEECDDGDTTSGDGCSDKCLNEGSTAAGFTCGDKLDLGEDNDLGSAEANKAAGLNSECLHVGSVYKTPAVGAAAFPVCGNGLIESGEECESVASLAPNANKCNLGLAGNCILPEYCSNKCLNKGVKACDAAAGLTSGCCGNGGDPESGEDCDDGNLINGDGCNNSCLHEGSNLLYGSACQNKEAETGEDSICEFSTVANYIGKSPLAIATIKDYDYLSLKLLEGVANITATTQSTGAAKSASAVLKYKFDYDKCKEEPESVDCKGKCFDSDLTKVPGDNLCRNGVAQFTISPQVKSSVGEELGYENFVLINHTVGDITISTDSYQVTVSEETETILDKTVVNTVVSLNLIKPDTKEIIPFDSKTEYYVIFKNLINNCNQAQFIVNAGTGEEEPKFQSFATADNFCRFDYVGFSPSYYLFTSSTSDDAKSKTSVDFAARSSNGDLLIPIANYYSWTWNIESQDTNVVMVEKMVNSVDGTNTADVRAANKNGTTTVTATATIDYDQIFNESVEGSLRTVDGFGNFEVFLCENPWSWVDDYSNIRLRYCRDAGVTGTAEDLPYLRKGVSGLAGDGSGNCNNGSDDDLDGLIDYNGKDVSIDIHGGFHSITTPEYSANVAFIGNYVFRFNTDDSSSKVKYYYGPDKNDVRVVSFDSGEKKVLDFVKNNQTYKIEVELVYDFATIYTNPVLTANARLIFVPKDTNCSSIDDSESEISIPVNTELGEYFFLRSHEVGAEACDGAPCLDDKYPDAIALRVYANPKNISARQWYYENVPIAGNPSDLQVACDNDPLYGATTCYHGVRDGNTIYVSGGNLAGTKLYNNIYVLGYSKGSNSTTTNIFSQMVNNLRLNTDLETGNQTISYQAVKRDIKRVNDLNYLKQLFAKYKSQNNAYPKLDSGTYQRGLALSVWPSWQSVLGGLLGAKVPTDPINRFYTYEAFPVDPAVTKTETWNVPPAISAIASKLCPSTEPTCLKSITKTQCLDDDLSCQCADPSLDVCYTNDQCFMQGTKAMCSICGPGSDPVTCFDSTGLGLKLEDGQNEFFLSPSYLFGYQISDGGQAGLFYKFEGLETKNGYQMNNESSIGIAPLP